MALPARSEIDKKYTWDAESVYKNAAAWEADTEGLLKQVEALGAFKGRLAESATVLAAGARRPVHLVLADPPYEVDNAQVANSHRRGGQRAGGVDCQRAVRDVDRRAGVAQTRVTRARQAVLAGEVSGDQTTHHLRAAAAPNLFVGIEVRQQFLINKNLYRFHVDIIC